MTTKFLLSILAASIVIASVFWSNQGSYTPAIDFYSLHIRGSLFTGFLTLGGFLLSLKTFIIVKMKESVYDSKAYTENFAEKKKRNNSLSLYKPLQNLSHLLFWAILSAITTSALQFTIGLFETEWSTVVCIFMAAFTITLLVLSLFEIKKNLDTWFEFTENKNTENKQEGDW